MGKTFFVEAKDDKGRIMIPKSARDDLKIKPGMWLKVTIEVMQE